MKTKYEFMAKFDKNMAEYEIFLNKEIFCHVSECDFEILKKCLKHPIKIWETDQIRIQDWTGKVLYEGDFDHKDVQKVLKANRCLCRTKKKFKDQSSDGVCLQCDDTGYIGDFEVYWIDDNDEIVEHDKRNVYEYIDY
jgi:hypothetical protein